MAARRPRRVTARCAEGSALEEPPDRTTEVAQQPEKGQIIVRTKRLRRALVIKDVSRSRLMDPGRGDEGADGTVPEEGGGIGASDSTLTLMGTEVKGNTAGIFDSDPVDGP